MACLHRFHVACHHKTGLCRLCSYFAKQNGLFWLLTLFVIVQSIAFPQTCFKSKFCQFFTWHLASLKPHCCTIYVGSTSWFMQPLPFPCENSSFSSDALPRCFSHVCVPEGEMHVRKSQLFFISGRVVLDTALISSCVSPSNMKT